jgi:hypothetical protein
VAQRYKTPVGEIDLVALKGKHLAFIEVKVTDDAAWTRFPRGRSGGSCAQRNIGSRATQPMPVTTSPSTSCSPSWAWPRYSADA